MTTGAIPFVTGLPWDAMAIAPVAAGSGGRAGAGLDAIDASSGFSFWASPMIALSAASGKLSSRRDSSIVCSSEGPFSSRGGEGHPHHLVPTASRGTEALRVGEQGLMSLDTTNLVPASTLQCNALSESRNAAASAKSTG